MPVLTTDMVPGLIRAGASARVAADVAPRFKAGDEVVIRNINPPTHTRLPRYLRGKRGIVDRDHGVFVFPDSNAHRQGERPQHVYSVRFTAQELWGRDMTERNALYVDMWDDYMDPA